MSYIQILRLNVGLVLFILFSAIVNADDVIVEIGNVYAEKNNELFLSLKNTEAGGHDYRLVSAGSLGGIGVGKFAVYDATANSARLTIDSDGDVGIGTPSPTQRLTLTDGVLYITGTGVSHMTLNSAGSFYGKIQNDAADKWSLAYGSTQDTTLGTAALTWTGTGNIGIGNTAPETSLHIGSDTNAAAPGTGVMLQVERNGNSYIGITAIGGNEAGVLFGDGVNNVGRLIYNHDGDRFELYMGPTSARRLIYDTNSFAFQEATTISTTTGDLTLNPLGNLIVSGTSSVGIGTKSPATGNKLDVAGKIHATEDICTDLSGGKCLSTVSGAISETDPQVGTLTSNKWCVANSSGTAIDCNKNTPVLSETDPQVGTITNGKWCKATAGVVKCDQDTPAGDSDWVISGTDMYSGVSGKVGIGSAAPKTLLDVAGEIKFGNTGLACDSNAAGAVRYNSVSKVMEFCDGSAWKLFSGGTTPPPPPPAAKTKVQCSVDGSATDTSTTACSQPTCDEVSQNTYDDCSGEASCSTDGYMYVNDVKLEGTIATGGSVTPSVQVYCYNSGTQWAIYFYGGTSWTQKCSGSCTGSGLEWKSCPTFNLPSSSGTYYLRGITSWWDTITAACVTTTYGDHDDIKIQI